MTKSHRASEKTNQPVDARRTSMANAAARHSNSSNNFAQPAHLCSRLSLHSPPRAPPGDSAVHGLGQSEASRVLGGAPRACVCVCVSTPRASSQSFFFWKQHHIPLPYTKKVYAIKSPMEADAARLFGICDQSPMEADLARFFSSSPPTAPVSCDDLTSHRLSSRERRGEQGRLPPASALLADSAACLVTEALAPTELRCPKIERPEKLLERRVVFQDFSFFLSGDSDGGRDREEGGWKYGCQRGAK